MRIKLIVAAVLAVALATPAAAADLSGIGAQIFGNSTFNFSRVNLERAPVSAIGVGGFEVKLQGTTLAEIVKHFGGTILSADDATWLCFHTDGANVWFISNALGGHEFVMMVAVERTARMPEGCGTAPETFALPDLGIPGLGASAADLEAAFGAAASGGKMAYRHDRPGGYADIAQYIGYMLRGGKVVGYGVGETTVPTAH